MSVKVIMFHYVRPTNRNKFKHLNYFPLEQFCKFLDKELLRLKVISPEAYLEAVINGKAIPENALLLSFDDGLYDHYKWVYPELIKRKIGAFFFINTMPLLNKDMLLVHKIHALSGLMGYRDLRYQFVNKIRSADKFGNDFFENVKAKVAYPYDEFEVAGFKYALNYLLPNEIVLSTINELLSEKFNFDELYNEFYLKDSQIIEMYNEGMTFGYHGHSHKPFSRLTDEELKTELDIEYDFFQKNNINAKCLSYPYGDVTAVNSQNIEIIRQKKIQVAFMADQAYPYTKMQIPRVDCKEIFLGI